MQDITGRYDRHVRVMVMKVTHTRAQIRMGGIDFDAADAQDGDHRCI